VALSETIAHDVQKAVELPAHGFRQYPRAIDTDFVVLSPISSLAVGSDLHPHFCCIHTTYGPPTTATFFVSSLVALFAQYPQLITGKQGLDLSFRVLLCSRASDLVVKTCAHPLKKRRNTELGSFRQFAPTTSGGPPKWLRFAIAFPNALNGFHSKMGSFGQKRNWVRSVKAPQGPRAAFCQAARLRRPAP
jgi:hypothetical protein